MLTNTDAKIMREAGIVRAYAEKTDADLLRWHEDDEAVAVITGRGIAATEIETAIRSQGHE